VQLVPAVRATIGIFKPLEDAVVAEDVLALGQTQRMLTDAFRAGYAKVIIANYAGFDRSASNTQDKSRWE
jgi:hypothetical protein